MNKKVLSLILALVMVLGTFANVFAAEAKEASKDAKKAENGEKVEKIVGKDNKIQYIIDKKFVEGYEDGSMGYDKNITRAEITRLLVLANGNEDLAKQLQGSLKIYSDVELAHWANGVINVGTTRPSSANGIAMLAGYPDGSFKPDKNVSYAELAKMLVVLVKKDLTADMVKNAKWATSWMTWAAELGILEDVNVADSNAAANRADAFTMLYNALFYMKEFKRVPANEVRGIVSELNKSKLVLNEEKDKEYTITADTVYVRPTESKQSQYIYVKTINFDSYMLGSLVRVLVNDKKEVTHIIELGNPAELAIENNNAMANDNNRTWKGVADSTVETSFLRDIVSSDKGQQAGINDSYVTVKLNKTNVKADSIVFHNIKNVKGNEVALRVTDKTEVYVANPYNNIMKKVDSIQAALLLIGFRDYSYNGFRIANVYAGFDSDGARDAWKGLKGIGEERHTAKVIVFNVVSKYVGGEKYRILNSVSSQFKDTVENTDGKLFDRNNWNDTSVFPLEYGDHLDVIEVNPVRSASNHKVLIDHDAIREFPIVEVTEKDGSNYLEVVDMHGEKTLLDIRDADIFSAKRFDTPLSVGSKIQFRVKNHKKATANNVAEVISILPRDTKLEGSIYGVLPSAFAGQERGTVVEVTNIESTHPTVTMKVDYNVFNAADSRGYATFNISKDTALKLQPYVETNTKIEFKVFKDLGWAGKFYATDFRLDGAKKGLDNPAAPASQESLENKVKKLVNEYEGKVNCGNLLKVQAEIEKLDKEIEGYKKENWNFKWEAGNVHYDKYQVFKGEVDAVKGSFNSVKEKLAVVIKSFDGIDFGQEALTKETVETKLKEKLVDGNGYKYELLGVQLIEATQFTGYVVKGTVKATLTEDNKVCCVSSTFELTVKSNKCEKVEPGEPKIECGSVDGNGTCPAK